MALQGDLHSFALADVLRLLAATAKSGRLDVAGDGATGEVWFDGGELVGGEVTCAPHASRSADVVFEMMRFENGTFRFDEGMAPPDSPERTDVEAVIEAAEDLVAQWAVIERVVPSVHSWVELAPQIEHETVSVTGDQWRLVASIATGATARVLGDRFEMTDLESMGRVKELVELGLVEVGDIVEVAHPVSGDSELDRRLDADELTQLSTEDGAVVLESRDDALLPEPLPGEGTSYVGELSELADLGTVDGRYAAPERNVGWGPEADEATATFGADVDPDDLGAPVDRDDTGTDEVAEVAADLEDEALGADIYDETAFVVDDDTEEVDAADGLDRGPVAEADTAATDLWAAPPADSDTADDGELAAVAAHDGVAEDGEDTDDRGSLLRFLSSVKP